jgi:diguanylate cyclase (GGDEF)-like protein
VFERAVHPGRVGLALVLVSAGLMTSTVWLLPASQEDHVVACLVGAATAAAGLGWRAVTRQRERPGSALGYPLIVFGGLAVLGAATTGIGMSYGGLLTLSFIYIGLYTPPGSTLRLLAPAAASWLIANDIVHTTPTRGLDVRLPMALLIWAAVGGMLSRHAEATRKAAAALRREARHDPLTGLRNRRALDDLLADAASGDAVAVLDIDHFKVVNDQRGHSGGDGVLVAFARVLLRSLRDQDVAARFGGDEFLLYLPQTDLDQVEAILRRIRAAWAQREHTITFSAGIAPVRRGRDGNEAFGEADRYLYQAKAAGRNQWARPEVVVVPLPRTGEDAAARSVQN